jgi:hypothetical protein
VLKPPVSRFPGLEKLETARVNHASHSKSATMNARHIIPVPAATSGDELVVVEVQQEGSHPLDVRLVGCEGESPYVISSKIALYHIHFVCLICVCS